MKKSEVCMYDRDGDGGFFFFNLYLEIVYVCVNICV